ncbi:hypothetical protein FZW96_13830 [Bacillus sp. BGMRC 2118]|nr:hypothetical protein FZW96_13830 [Bacillus sp. BGMRC 2118]
MRILFALPFILLGSILISVTIDDYGTFGNIMLKVVGFLSFCTGLFIGKKKKTHNNNNNNNDKAT